MVCDQPFVSSSLLNELIATQKNTGKPIVTSQYENAIGPPALFHKTIFPELMELKGDAGARKIIEQRSNDVATVLFKKGNIDIDTEADYQIFAVDVQNCISNFGISVLPSCTPGALNFVPYQAIYPVASNFPHCVPEQIRQ